MKAFRIMGRALKAVYEELFLCVWLSVVWWLGTILVVTAPSALMGLQHVANRQANYKRVDQGFFWDNIRTHLGSGWILFWLSALLPPAIYFNIWFYGNAVGFMRYIGIVWLWLLFLWLLIGQYLFPLLWQQDEPNVRLALRNAALLAVKYPLYSILMLLFQVVLIVVSVGIVLPLPLLLPAMIALTQNFATVGLLQEMGLASQPPESEAEKRA